MTTLTIEDALVAEELPPLKETEIRFKSRPAAQLHAKHVLSNSTALHQSILDGRMHSLNYFLKMGFKPNTKDKYGRTSLMLACLSDHESYGMQVAKLLFKHGADVNEQDSLGRTAVFIAISENREALFDYFIDHQSSSMDFKLKDNDGNALINHAAMYGNSRMVRKVINVMKERGIDLDMRNKSGFTALLLAIQSDRFLNAYILLKHGQCSTTLKDNDRRLNAIEWLLNRIEVNKDILLNTPEKPETNLNVVRK
jgi:ankyrin repeat protein